MTQVMEEVENNKESEKEVQQELNDNKRKRTDTPPLQEDYQVQVPLPKRTRVKTFKGGQYSNYAEAHSGRCKRYRTGDKFQSYFKRSSKKPRSEFEEEGDEGEDRDTA